MRVEEGRNGPWRGGGQNVGLRTLTLTAVPSTCDYATTTPPLLPATSTRLGEAWEEAVGTLRSLSLSGGRAEGQARAQI